MGVPESKPSLATSSNFGSTGSLRRSSYKANTTDQIQSRHELVRSIQSDIEIFAGSRTDERYKELQQILVKTSADLEQIRRKSNKDRTRDRCDQVIKEVQASIQKLEAKLVVNASVEKGLDLAAVETDSFVNQSFYKPVSNKQQYVRPEIAKSLDDIEFQLQNLEKQVKLAIELEDTNQFTILEKKITILYGDLVMVQIEDNTPLSERREVIERRLITCNNQIKKSRRILTKRLSQRTSIAADSESIDELEKIQQRLSDLELEALTFGGVKSDTRYKELEQILEQYWTNMYARDVFTEEERSKRDVAVEKAKQILQELRKRSEENERQAQALKSLNSVEQQVDILRKDVHAFKGSGTDAEYMRLDQDARRLWANLNDIEETSEAITRNKIAAVAEIKGVLKDLSQATKSRESLILEDIQQKQLLKQVEEFRNHWNQLNHNLNEKPILDSSVSISIIEMLETVLEGLRKKTRTLSTLENRKSNASLVIAKVSDTSDMYIKYKSAPDLVPQQLGIPDTDTKTPTMTKTKIIAEMHHINNDAKNLLQEIKQATYLKKEEIESYENKLNQFKKRLDNLDYNKKSETIESTRRRVTELIEKCIKALEEKTNTEQAKSNSALQIMDVDVEIQYWRQQIKNFTGTSKDKQYEKIKNGLAESLIKLQVLGDQQVTKQDSIQHIQRHHQELENKLAENQAKEKCAEIKRQTSQEMKAIVEQVQKQKSQVDRFNGTYKGILYKQIEENLNSSCNKLDALDTKNDERLENARTQTKQKIQKYLTILEEKSAKPIKAQNDPAQDLLKMQESNILKETTAYQRVYSEDVKEKPVQIQTAATNDELPHHKVNAIRENLVAIKEKVEAFSGLYNSPQFIAIKQEMQENLDKLKVINDKGYPTVSSSKEQYIGYIEQLQQYFEEKTLATEGEMRESDEV